MTGQFLAARLSPKEALEQPFYVCGEGKNVEWGGPVEAFRFTDLATAYRFAETDPDNIKIFEILKEH